MIMPMLTVKNFAASQKFYTETLGFKQSLSMKDEAGNETFGIFEFGAASFGLGLDPEGRDPYATVQFMVYVPEDTDLDQYYAEVKARGGAADDLKTEYWGDRKFDIKDPDGYWLTLCKTVKQVTPEEAAAYNITFSSASSG